jgi:DNA-binding NarL/FixJ family response regulator
MKLMSYLHRKSKTVLNTLLVDDHAILLEGVERLVNELEGFHVSHTASTVRASLDLLKSANIDLLITDYNLPDDSGLTLIREAKKLKPSLKIVMLSMHDEAHLVKEVLKEGVDAYVLKKDTMSELTTALKAVKNGKIHLSSDINSMLVRDLNKTESPQLLTNREREILQLISGEYSNKMIGEKLFISERTVETHRKNIFRKTKTNSIVGLIKFAITNNLVAK